jgi:hypothetical protein
MATSSLHNWNPRIPANQNGERRLGRRYHLSLPLTVRRATDYPVKRGAVPPRLPGFPSGLTRDVSTDGIYFTIDQVLEPGQELVFTLTLPASLTSGAEVFICGRGRVLRTEKRIEDGVARLGVAAMIERHEIVRQEPLEPPDFIA